MDLGQRLATIALIGVGAILLGGCASYYQVRDPSTGTVYYSHDVDDEGEAGAVRFKDERSGKVVTLPTSEVRKISRDRYYEGLEGHD